MSLQEPIKLWSWLKVEKRKIDNRPGPPGTLEGVKQFRKHRKMADQLFREGKFAEAKAMLEIALKYYRDEI